MYHRQLLWKLVPLYQLRPLRPQSRIQVPQRFNSSRPPDSTFKTRASVSRILDRVPHPLRKYTDRLRTAPVTHIVSFLVLHEITAVVPVVGLSYYFHVTGWLPVGFSDETIAVYTEKFGSYFRRKGWFGLSNDNVAQTSSGARLLLEVATAYTITKAVVIPRILLSIWATPWFARVVLGKVGMALAGFGQWRRRISQLRKNAKK